MCVALAELIPPLDFINFHQFLRVKITLLRQLITSGSYRQRPQGQWGGCRRPMVWVRDKRTPFPDLLCGYCLDSSCPRNKISNARKASLLSLSELVCEWKAVAKARVTASSKVTQVTFVIFHHPLGDGKFFFWHFTVTFSHRWFDCHWQYSRKGVKLCLPCNL